MRSLAFAIVLVLARLAAAQNDGPPIPCSNNADCNSVKLPKDAICKNAYCVCKDENNQLRNCSFANIAHMEMGRAVVGSNCKHNHDCKLENGFCNTTRSQCDCMNGFVSSTNGRKCLAAVVSLGSPCVDDKQCLALLANTTCLKDQCVCSDGFHFAEGLCVKSVDFGYPCKQTKECSHVVGALCTSSGKCGCIPSEIISEDGQKCLPAATLMNQECTENIQCQTTFPDAECIDKRCACKKDHHFVGVIKKCVVNRAFGEPCHSSHECYQDEEEYEPKALQCIADYCECASGYYRIGNRCSSSASIASHLCPAIILFVIAAFLAR